MLPSGGLDESMRVSGSYFIKRFHKRFVLRVYFKNVLYF